MPSFTDIFNNLIRKPSSAIWLLVLLGVVIYANALPNEMFWDDNDFILNNQFIHDWQYWPHFFTDNVIAGAHLVSNYWRPLLQIIFAIEWHLWADWAPGWHAVSALSHIGAGIALFKAFKVLLANRRLAWLCAAIFIVHPVQTESVVYPNSMGDALASIFIFWGLYFYTRHHQAKSRCSWWLAVAMYPLALMSKETGILLAGYLALADFFILQKTGTLWSKAWQTIRNLWPFIAVAAGYLALRATVLNFANSFNFYNSTNAFTEHFGLRIVVFFQTLATYTGLLFTPYDLRVERVIQPPQHLLTPEVFFGGAIFFILIALVMHYWHRRPLITFGILWFLISILPTSNLIVVINAVFYEHFLYTALIGLWLVVFLVLNKKQFWPVFIIILILFSGRSLVRTLDWRTAIGFYEKLILTAPNSYRVINNLGMEYADKNRLIEAEATYKKAIAVDPQNAVAWHNMGHLCQHTGRTEEAIRHFEKAISLQKNFIFSYKALAQLYLDHNDYGNARRVMEEYLNYTEEKDYTLNILIELARRQKDAAGMQRYTQAWQRLHEK